MCFTHTDDKILICCPARVNTSFCARNSWNTGETYMTPINGLDSFWPYDSIDDLFEEKTQPEFGLVPSKWHFDLSSWRFFHAENRDMVPIGFEHPSFADDMWDAVELPSVWQQEGYGLPVNLAYDAGSVTEESKLSKRIHSKLNTLAGSDADDDVGVYRTWMVLPASYYERAVYFACSGIRGRFELFVNGRLATTASAWYSPQRILISPFLQGENNLITLLIYRLDADRHGRIRKENGTFGYSGIFRMPEIVAESFVEVSGLHLFTSWLDPVRTDTIRIDDPHSTDSIRTDDPSVGINSNTGDSTPATPDHPGLSPMEIGRRGRLRMRVFLHNHMDRAIPVRIECILLCVGSEYDIYHLPVLQSTMQNDLQGEISAISDIRLESELYADQVLPWTDKTPYLYDLVLTVKDHHDRIICIKKRRFGFRTSEVIGRIFHINDTALPLRVVRYFDFDPVGGLAVPVERMRQDICLMKQANLNAVIVAHFPADPVFYQLCDQYGLYVISQSEASQMHTMMESLMTHPCIILWSFAPLHFDEGKLWELKQKLLILDGSRPFYSEKDRTFALTDIPPFPCEAGSFFGEWSDICVDRKVLQSKLEPGNPLFASRKGRPLQDETSNDFRWIHQGDLEEYHEKNDVPIALGIVSADRFPHPTYYEMKKQCETLQFIASPDHPAELTLHNLHPIGETLDLMLYWQILLGGLQLRGGRGIVKSLPPLGEKVIRFPFEVADYLVSGWMQADEHIRCIFDASICHELVFDVRVCLANDTDYAPAGHEIAFYQQVLLENTAGYSENGQGSSAHLPAVADAQMLAAADTGSASKLIVSTLPQTLQVAHTAMQAAFSRNSGGLCSILAGERELFAGSMQPSFFRAATNSDRSDHSFVLAATVFSKETDWRTIQSDLRYERCKYEMIGDDFSMLVQYKSFAFKGDVLVQYLMHSDGKLAVTLAFTPRYDLQRCGFRVHIPRLMNRISWYGRGFHEAYPDRKESARLGFYEATPELLYHAYARPQENGGHCDTQYLVLSDGSGKGVRITSGGEDRFSFAASLFSPEETDDHQHQEELASNGTYELFLDFYQRGIERTGQETGQFVRNRKYRGTFIFESWEDVQPAPSDHEPP